jgi:hypothetical protein
MRVCIAHKEKAIVTLRNINDDAEYDLCQACFEQILPTLTGDLKNRPGRPAKSKDGK